MWEFIDIWESNHAPRLLTILTGLTNILQLYSCRYESCTFANEILWLQLNSFLVSFIRRRLESVQARTSATQFSIFLSAASWDASECDRKERQISVSSALGIRQWSWINQQRILTRERVPDSFPVVLLTQSRMHPICNSSLESAF